MKVKDLIRKLQEFNGDSEIEITDGHKGVAYFITPENINVVNDGWHRFIDIGVGGCEIVSEGRRAFLAGCKYGQKELDGMKKASVANHRRQFNLNSEAIRSAVAKFGNKPHSLGEKAEHIFWKSLKEKTVKRGAYRLTRAKNEHLYIVRLNPLNAFWVTGRTQTHLASINHRMIDYWIKDGQLKYEGRWEGWD